MYNYRSQYTSRYTPRRLDQRVGNFSPGERRDLVPDLPLRPRVREVPLKHPIIRYPGTPCGGRFVPLMDRQGLYTGSQHERTA